MLVLASIVKASATTNGPVTAEQFGWRVLISFRHTSVEEYRRLFPSIEELHNVMQQNEHFYGVFVGMAKEDLKAVYDTKVIPELEKAFAQIIDEGHSKGIDWSRVIFLEASEKNSQGNDGTGSVVIHFTCDSKPYQLVVDKAFQIDGEWRATQFLSVY